MKFTMTRRRALFLTASVLAAPLAIINFPQKKMRDKLFVYGGWVLRESDLQQLQD